MSCRMSFVDPPPSRRTLVMTSCQNPVPPVSRRNCHHCRWGSELAPAFQRIEVAPILPIRRAAASATNVHENNSPFRLSVG